METKVCHFRERYELSRNAVEYILSVARHQVDRQGIFTLVLAGGNTPRTLYELLALSPFREEMPWVQTHFFWGDERCVSPGHRDSNYAMAYRALFSHVPVPEQNIHRMPGEIEPPENAAAAYEKELRAFFRCGGAMPSFHCILLGIGSDGHTASLFPGTEQLNEYKRWVVGSDAPPGVQPSRRITLTLPVINNAERVLFLVSGEEKRQVVSAVLSGDKAGEPYPSNRVRALQEVVWYLDFDTDTPE